MGLQIAGCVLIVDDNRLCREAMRKHLETRPDIHVVGEAGDGESAIDLVRRTRPNLVLMDVTMSGMGGIEATRRIRATSPAEPRIIMISMHTERKYIDAALAGGASGYLFKMNAVSESFKAMDHVMGGGVYLGADLEIFLDMKRG